MNKFILLSLIFLSLNGCATIGVGTAELTGVALLNDRRSAQSILVDEKIENYALVNLNLDADVRENSHLNVTSYNGLALITGETLYQALLGRISAIVQAISDVRIVKNRVQIGETSSFGNRANDSLLTARVKTALTRDSRLAGFDATRIKVVSEDGRVFLMGIVYPKEADAAVEITKQQSGVREVIKVFEYL